MIPQPPFTSPNLYSHAKVVARRPLGIVEEFIWITIVPSNEELFVPIECSDRKSAFGSNHVLYNKHKRTYVTYVCIQRKHAHRHTFVCVSLSFRHRTILSCLFMADFVQPRREAVLSWFVPRFSKIQ